MRKYIALMLALLVLCTSGMAEESVPETEIAETVINSLFIAAAGTENDREAKLRSGMSAEELLLRNEENAAYRATVLPWLLASLKREEEELQASVEAEPEIDIETEETKEAEEALRQERLHAAYDAMLGNEAGKAYMELLFSIGAEGLEDCLSLTQRYFQIWLSGIEAERLMQINEDFAFWLYCPDSPIDYPVVQTTDNDYYLHRLFNGEYNAAGTLFVDYRNLPMLQDPNTLIYGHHMRNDSMFGSLDWYREQSYFDSHPYMLVIGKDEIDVIELFSAYTTGSDDECYDIAISDEEDLRIFVDTALRKSDFAYIPEIGNGDRLITLSTCAYAFRNARYIVIGRLLTTWKSEPFETIESCPVATETDKNV